LLSLPYKPEQMNKMAKLLLLELTEDEDWPNYICEPRREPEAPKRAMPTKIVNKIKGNVENF
jgi:hypothetical protein